MSHVRVASAHLTSVAYDQATQTLEVAFLNGAVHEYRRVPASVHAGLMAAASHSGYFEEHVQKAGYPNRRLR